VWGGGERRAVNPAGALRRMNDQWRALLTTLSRHVIWIWISRTWHGFFEHRNFVNASALTYSTMLAVVPLVAVVLSLLKAAGFDDALRPFMLDQFPVLDAEVVDGLLDYIDRANAQAVGGIGFVALLVTCWAMLGTVEASLNHILGVREQRGYIRRTREYLAMLIVGAVMVVLSIAGRTILQSPLLLEQLYGVEMARGAPGLLLTSMPWVTAWVAFFFMYTWMPNRVVNWRSALFGAVVGGTLFQTVQLGYIELQLGFARYHAVYGALAQLPILLVWVYLSWIVVLVGAEGIAARATLRERTPTLAEGPGRGMIALAALREIMDAFQSGRPVPLAPELAVRLGVSVQAVHAALAPLLGAGILVPPSETHGYLPASSPGSISLERVLEALPPREATG